MSNISHSNSHFANHPAQQQLHPTYSSPDVSSSFAGYSQTSSSTTTSRPSPTSDDLNYPSRNQQPRLQLQAQFLSPAPHSTAPLPSPSSNNIDPFSARSQIQQHSFMTRQEAQGNMPQAQNTSFGGQQSQNQPQHNQHHNSFSQTNRPILQQPTTEQIPPGLPPDFLAEAAKRAQMACLMRDMGDVSL